MNKKIINLFKCFIPVIAFLATTIIASFGGGLISSSSQSSRIESFIYNVCNTRIYGEALFANAKLTEKIDYQELESTKNKFAEKLNNRLSLCGTDFTIQTPNCDMGATTLIECGVENENYNDYYIYSSYNWKLINTTVDAAFISETLYKKICAQEKVQSAIDMQITIQGNSRNVKLKIAGWYSTIVSDYKGTFTRGRLLHSLYSEPIFTSANSLYSLAADELFAMFSADATKNGEKYDVLNNYCAKHNTKLEFDFKNDAAMMERWNNASQDKTIVGALLLGIFITLISIVGIVYSIILVKDLASSGIMNSPTKIKVFEIISYILSLCIPLLILLIFKKKTVSFGFVVISLINNVTVSLCVVYSLAMLLFLIIKYHSFTSKSILFDNNFIYERSDDEKKIKHCLFIGNFYLDSYLEKLPKDANYSLANTRYEESFINLLEKMYDTVDVVTYPAFIGNTKYRIKKCFEQKNNRRTWIISTTNSKSRYILFRHHLIRKQLNELNETNNYDSIYLSTYHCAFAIEYTKFLFRGAKVNLLLPDLPLVEIGSYSKKYRLRLKITDYHLRKNLRYLDCLLPITKQEGEYLKFPVEKTVVYESYFKNENKKDRTIKKENTIFYAGAINKQYGIQKMMDEFLISNASKEYKLKLCGGGPDIELVKEYAKEHKNIVYLGIIPKDEAFLNERMSKLLIVSDATDRPYSFHSKYLEYLASGTPVLTYLPSGAKDEYVKLMNIIEQDLHSEIDKILLSNYTAYEKKGLKAREFILNNRDENYFIEMLKKIK